MVLSSPVCSHSPAPYGPDMHEIDPPPVAAPVASTAILDEGLRDEARARSLTAFDAGRGPADEGGEG